MAKKHHIEFNEQPSSDPKDPLWNKTSLPKAEAFVPDPETAWKRTQLKIRLREKPAINWPMRLAAAAVLVIGATLIFKLLQPQVAPEVFQLTAVNDLEVVALPDGSRMWLSRNSMVEYTSDFINQREVKLEGKAFFEVEKREGKRFTVQTATTTTEVLGTSFLVETQPDGSALVQVATGKVTFATNTSDHRVILMPGEQSTFSSKAIEPLAKTEIEDPNYRAWQNQKLTFSNVSMVKLVSTLEKHYQTSIKLSPELANCRFTVSFDHQRLDEVLEILEITGDLTITNTPTGYELSGKKCD